MIIMKFKRTENGYYLKLDRGEEVIGSLTEFAEQEDITAAVFSGIGAFKDLEVGYYDLENREYPRQEFKGSYEVLSCKGNFALKDGKPVPHCHIVFSDIHYQAHGGHLFRATVEVTGEFYFATDGENLERRYDESVGLSLWDL